MKALTWLFRLAFFLVALWFALKNTAPVTVRLTESIAWVDVPLIVVMLACLVVGALAALIAVAPKLWARAQPARPPAPKPKTLGGLRPGQPVEVANDRIADAARNVGAVGELDDSSTR
ncbi:MAG TPA: LapA family protein [Burkholderiaceae bacterium]|nr:LapA family protein [Burkholderiaceae bacterium]